MLPDDSPSRYLIARLDGEDVGGISSSEAATATWNTYVAVADAGETAARPETLGAGVVSEPEVSGHAGISAVLTDAEGAEIRLWQADRRLGSQVVNGPGTWNFSDLHSADPPASKEFYTASFGWRFDDLGFATMIGRPGYGDHLEATVDPGIRSRQFQVHSPVGFEDAIGWHATAAAGEPPHWHVTFSVADRDDFVELAERLGGQVLTSEESQWSRTALLRDPRGAEFTASQFTPPSN